MRLEAFGRNRRTEAGTKADALGTVTSENASEMQAKMQTKMQTKMETKMEQKKSIHVSKLRLVMEKETEKGERVPFSFEYVSLKGERVRGSEAVCVAVYVDEGTRMVKWTDSGKEKVRKMKDCLFVRVNEMVVIG